MSIAAAPSLSAPTTRSLTWCDKHAYVLLCHNSGTFGWYGTGRCPAGRPASGEHNMKMVAGGVRRVLCGAVVLGLAVAAQAGAAPSRASTTGVSRGVTRTAPVRHPVPASARHAVTGSSAVVKPKT